MDIQEKTLISLARLKFAGPHDFEIQPIRYFPANASRLPTKKPANTLKKYRVNRKLTKCQA